MEKMSGVDRLKNIQWRSFAEEQHGVLSEKLDGIKEYRKGIPYAESECAHCGFIDLPF